ncbi:NAD(P)H-dependent oxidoreductase [Vreelandella alkaliphila]|uniref:Flavodoxin n=1 Tax=Halomonas campaniensis TaxID=213554 RepID=A0A3D0KHQ7_9GAMM|nr:MULTISPECIES: flavodoxin family protein [unclassified Halomonas]HBS82209.1 flavodoxin [Halomonas campaniensis]HCA02820.1 flavodoxin [Halomonas campaniensis]
MNVAVVFHSALGSTKQLAQAVAAGAAAQPGVDAIQIEIVGADIVEGRFCNTELLQQLDKADALVFGSPTYMGCVSAQFKAFSDATSELWAKQLWADKIAAGFTIGANLSGDQLNTLQYMQVFANQHGMCWVGLDIPGNYDPGMRNRLGAQSGLIAHSTDGVLNETDLLAARYLGQRVAQVSKKFAA